MTKPSLVMESLIIWKNERIRHAVYASLLVPGRCESVAHSEGVCPSGV